MKMDISLLDIERESEITDEETNSAKDKFIRKRKNHTQMRKYIYSTFNFRF